MSILGNDFVNSLVTNDTASYNIRPFAHDSHHALWVSHM